MAENAPRSRRFADRAQRELRRETLIAPDPALGLVAMDGPNDPQPSLVVEDGVVVELDGRARDDFDVIDFFLADHGLDLDAAAECAALDDAELAHRMVDVVGARATSSCASRAASRRPGWRASWPGSTPSR